MDKVEKQQQNQIEKRSQSSNEEYYLRSLIERTFTQKFFKIKRKHHQKRDLSSSDYKMNLQQQQLTENVQSREEREFWSSKNIFNNALEMMKSYKNESLAE